MVINVLLILNKRNQNDVLGFTITHIIVMKYLPTRNVWENKLTNINDIIFIR